MISLSALADYGKTGQYIARIIGRDPKFTFEREFIGRKCGKRNETTEADVDDPGLYEECDIDRKRGKNSSFVLVLDVDGDLYKYNSDKEDAMIIAKAMDSGRKFSDIVVGYRTAPEILLLQTTLNACKKMVLNSATETELDAEITICKAFGPYSTGMVVKNRDFQPLLKIEIERLEEELTALRNAGKPDHSGYEIVDAKEAEKRQAAQTLETATAACWEVLQSLPVKDAKKVLTLLKDKLNPATSGVDTGKV